MLLIPLFILIFFLGIEITAILRSKVNWAERLSLSFLFGIGISTFVVFLLAFVAHLDFSLKNTFIILISLCLSILPISLRQIIFIFKDIKIKKKKLKKSTILFWGLILSIFIHTLISNSFWPIADWDAIALYDFRAKVFLFDVNLVHAATTNIYFMGYPLLTSLAHLFVYQTGINNPKFIYSLFYLSFIVIFYFSLRRHTNEKKSMLFTILLSVIPEIFSHSMVAYTNLAYTIFLGTGTFYLYDWLKNKDKSFLLTSALLVGLSCWVRSAETFWVIPIFIVVLASIKDKNWKNVLSYLLIFLAIKVPWNLFMTYITSGVVSAAAITSDAGYLSFFKRLDLQKIFSVVRFLYENIFSTWGLIFLVFISVFVDDLLNRKSKHNMFIYITLLSFLLLFVGTLLFSVSFPGWQDIPDSARRMSMFLLPLMVYSMAVGI